MEIQTAWDTLIEASRHFRGPSTQEILLFLVILALVLAVITIPYLWSRIAHAREVEKAFFLRGKALGLSDKEVALLWKHMKDYPYDPQMVFDNKPLFEKIVTKIVNEDIEGVNLIPSIRSKLRFDTVPWFIPITNTRDIDLYQTGKLVVDNTYVDAAVWDKTETELHVVVLGPLPRAVHVGERVRFHFIRENEGRYSFESTVIDKYNDGDKVVLVLEHTDQINRIQLRESIRWKVNLPVEFALIDDFTEEAMKDITPVLGRIEDISVKGVRICTEEPITPVQGKYVLMNFAIGEHKFENLIGQIVNVISKKSSVCMGIKFLKLSRQEEKIIDKFILDEQRRLIKMYKVGEVE